MRELTMADLSVYTNHRLGICIITDVQSAGIPGFSFFENFVFEWQGVGVNHTWLDSVHDLFERLA